MRIDEQLAHGERILLQQQAPQQIVLQISHISDDIVHAPSYTLGIPLTAEECILLARDLLQIAMEMPPVANDELVELSYTDWNPVQSMYDPNLDK